jgi:hypothetical protein
MFVLRDTIELELIHGTCRFVLCLPFVKNILQIANRYESIYRRWPGWQRYPRRKLHVYPASLAE